MRLLRLAPLILIVLLLVACDSGRSGNSNPSGFGSSDTRFSSFVKNLFANTADDTDPVAINDREFTFPSNDDETAYDELL